VAANGPVALGSRKWRITPSANPPYRLSRRAAQQAALFHVHMERDRVEIKAVRLGQHTVVAAYIPST
jgi:hypothetical protein